MRRSGRHLVVAVVAALAVAAAGALTGCVPGKPAVTPAPTSTSGSPVFASDEEALAAAEEAYRAYLAVSDQIANDGGADPERIAALVTSERLADELRGSETFETQGIRTEGSTKFENLGLQEVQDRGSVRVSFYACWDASDVRVLNDLGEDITPADRINRQRLEIVVVASDPKEPFVLESDDLWSAQASC